MESVSCAVGFLDESSFLDDSEKLAKSFLGLFQDARLTFTAKSPSPPHQSQAAAHDSGASASDPISMAVAEKLKRIGDSIQSKVDAELTAILGKQPVMVMEQDQFTKTCRSVLIRCSGIIKNGWQQAYTVCYSMMRTVQELRQQPNLPASALMQREVHIQRFVGPAMEELGLDTWIQSQGRLEDITIEEVSSTSSKVPISGTSV